MPHQPAEIRFKDISSCLAPAITLLNQINDVIATPFLQAISNTTLSLITIAQNVKRNKDECIWLMEHIHPILTLYKIHTFIEAQQGGNKIKHLFRHSEMNTLRKDCHAGLEQAIMVFKLDTTLLMANSIVEIQKRAQDMHQEFLEMVANLSDDDIPEYDWLTEQSFSLLPPQPQIFHGRQSELEEIITSLTQQPARIAILGTGGMGKTSLAKAALHHPHVSGQYENRFFITSESATTSIELAALVGSHLGLKPGKDLTKLVVKYLARGPPCLLVLDNLETSWEPPQSRGGVEEFLSLLTDVSHLALIHTKMEIDHNARCRETGKDIADDCHDSKEIDQLLYFTDNMPLAVNLIAHLVDYEDGLSDVELTQCDLPIPDLARCRATLLRTSLAYFDDKRRLKSLVPIREHVHHFYPPSFSLFHPLSKYFQLLLDLYRKYHGLRQTNTQISQIISNMGNLQQLLLLELHPDNTDLGDAINCTISLSAFHRLTGHGYTALMDHVTSVFPQPCDHRIEAKFITERLNARLLYPMVDFDLLIDQGMSHFNSIDDQVLESQFYREVGSYYHYVKKDIVASRSFLEKALSLAKSSGNRSPEVLALNYIALLEYAIGQFHSANLFYEAFTLKTEVMCLMALGDLKESMVLLHRTRELMHLCALQGATQDRSAMGDVAEIHLLKSEYEEARKIHLQLLEIISHTEDPYQRAGSMLNIAAINVMIGVDLHEVPQYLQEATTIYRTRGLRTTRCDSVLADLHLTEGNMFIARKMFLQCVDDTWGKDHETVSYCLERLADAGRWNSANSNWTYRTVVIYLAYAKKIQAKLGLHKALLFLGDVFLNEGDEHTAHNLFAVALKGFTHMDIHRSRADCMLRLGDIAKHRGDLVKAAEFWKDAWSLFDRSSQAKEKARIDNRLALLYQDIPIEVEDPVPRFSGEKKQARGLYRNKNV
ncbi:hypothetical protein C8R44DRAFT_911033 [Mycena epipterygia]|nr:hypothetical protein C8R44DRAFT_911033 [Mycena epipterygia]